MTQCMNQCIDAGYVGSSSYPEAELLIVDMIVLISLTCISGIVIYLFVLCTYSKGLII